MSPFHRSRRLVTRFGGRRTRLAIVGAVAVLVVANALSSTGSPSAPAGDEAIDAWLDAQVADAGYPGASVAIVRNGRLEHLHVVGMADASGRPVTTDTPFVIGSLSKSLTSLAILRLVESGAIALDGAVADVLPGFRTAAIGERAAPITIRQLLDQTSGLPPTAADLSSPPSTLAGFAASLASVTPLAAPGERFTYANINAVVLGAVVEAVTGQPYPDAMRRLVFDPLGMTRTTADPAEARRLGLGDAHRLWFGLPVARAPLFRADLAPAGFIASTASDLSHPIEMLLAGGTWAGQPFLTPRSVEALTTGTASLPIGSARYAMGWVDDLRDGLRTVSHDGSTTDMASVQAFAPTTGTGIVLLANAQSIPYELLGKIGSIGLGALDRMLGRPAQGTLERFYLVVDAVLVALFAVWVRGLVRLARGVRRREPLPDASGLRRLAWIAIRSYADVVVPLVILLRAPVALSAPWTALARTDVGLVLLAIAVMRLADGGLRAAGWWRRRDVVAQARETVLDAPVGV